MKKRVFTACFATLLVSVVPFVSRAQSYKPLESISSFQVEIIVREDAVVHVVERIEYNFGTQERQGIIRDIPLSDAPGTFEKMSISNIRVTDGQGLLRPFTFTGGEVPLWGKIFSGLLTYTDVATIKIGTPLEYVTGKNTYIISYDVKNAIGYFDDRSEIYWNATGNDWLIPIERASVRVTLPGDQKAEAIPASYCGKLAESTPCGESEINYNEKENITTISYAPTERFEPEEGVTVAVGFPSDAVATPGVQDWLAHYAFRYWGVIPIPFVVYWWFRRSFSAWRSRKLFYQNNSIVAEYDAGEFDPLQVAGIANGTLKQKDISAQIIHLAIKGYLVIKREEKMYSFQSTEKSVSDLSTYNQALLSAIAGKTTKDLKYAFYKDIQAVIKVVEDEFLVSKGFVSSKSKLAPGAVCGLALFMSVNPGLFIWLLLGTQAGIAFSGTCLVIAFVSAVFRPRRYTLSPEGLVAEQKLRGLREYIAVAEEERIKFHNAPEKTIELFEKLLPYAMVFGLEKKWAGEFADIYTVPPTWYDGVFTNGFSGSAFADSLSDFAKTTTATYARVSPGSSGSSFSGSSGRGFSGGGGGGGGGRSW
ncbi:MAG: hypothetical protein RL538_552 [Candidatus Parcubacteria bacterium]|jgi:uncharacterized membrane protein YgcG